MDRFGLTDKVALVVGGGLGMGEAAAGAIAEVGCNVAVLDIDQGRAERVCEDIRQLGRIEPARTATFGSACTLASLPR